MRKTRQIQSLIVPSFLSLFIIFIFSASNCKEPKGQKYLGTYPLGDIKDYLYFKPGSMWVYECDSTGELDTQVMVKIDTPWITKSYIKLQQLYFTIQSKNEGSKYSCGQASNTIFYNENYKYYFGLDRVRTNSKFPEVGVDHVFFKPFDTSLYPISQYSQTYKGLLTNLSVFGNTYDSVHVFLVKTGGTFPVCKIKTWTDARLTFYWARKVGLVRLFVETNRDGFNTPIAFNWYLKEYKLK